MQRSPTKSSYLLSTIQALAVALLCGLGQIANAESFNYISAAELKQRLESPDKPLIVDIQPKSAHDAHHLPGAIATDAFPAKSDADRAKLAPAIARILASRDDVVIVCPGGGPPSKNAYTYLKEQGVPGSRMRILEKGQNGWPYSDLVRTGP
jgi:rhodanese-related sulfurtransferase